MESRIDRRKSRRRVRYRIRKKLSGSPASPRLAVFRSNKHIYVQAIDDTAGATLAHASSLEAGVRSDTGRVSKVESAKKVGELMAAKLREKGIEAVVFDRGGHLYHGRVRALAEAVRAGGLKF